MQVSAKELFRIAESCTGCGVIGVHQGHVCEPDKKLVEEHCPNCDELLLLIHAGKILFKGEQCACQDDEQCPFCPACCKDLRLLAVVPN